MKCFAKINISVGKCRHSPIFSMRAHIRDVYGTPYTTLHQQIFCRQKGSFRESENQIWVGESDG